MFIVKFYCRLQILVRIIMNAWFVGMLSFMRWKLWRLLLYWPHSSSPLESCIQKFWIFLVDCFIDLSNPVKYFKLEFYFSVKIIKLLRRKFKVPVIFFDISTYLRLNGFCCILSLNCNFYVISLFIYN
jgi:hypothetical protein